MTTRRSRPLRRSTLSLAVRHALFLSAVPLAAGFAAPAFAQSSDAGNPAVDASALPTVTATAPAAPSDTPPPYPGGQVASGARLGIFGNQRLIDVPFSVTSYTAQAIEDQQARTLADVLDDDPAVRSAFGYGNFSQTFVIRGFPLNGDDIGLNGLFGLAPRQLVNVDAVERVQVFKGASAFVNGVTPSGSGIGGSIDLELKRATDKPITRITVEGTASGEIGAHADVGRRFGSEGQFGIRVNTSAMGGETAIDGEHRRSRDTSVALDYRGDKLRVSADFIYQRQRITDGRSVVYVTGAALPTVPSATYNYAQNWVYSELEDTVGMLRAEYDFAPNWTVYAAGGAHHTNEHGDYSSPSYNSTTGLTTASRLGVPYKSDSLAGELGVRGRFATGPVTHMVNAAGSITRVESGAAYDLSYPSFATSLYNTPQVARPAAAYVGGDFADPNTTSRVLIRSLAVSDTLGFLNDRILFTAGLRRQEINVNGYSYTGTQNAAYNDGITTPIFGVVFKPLDNVAIYANRSEGLAQGGTAPTGSINVGQALPPYRSKQVEAGVKYDAKTYGATLAFFQIKQPSAYTDPTTLVYGTNGTQRHRGVELSVFGEPVRGVRLLGGASYIDAKQQETANGATDGNSPIGVPNWLFNLRAEWDVPQLSGLTLSARMIHTGRQYLNATNTIELSSWNRFDLGARYRTRIANHETTFRATVFNVANKAYWASSLGGYLSQGAPRTLMLSLTTDF
nr:TonB-dependent siderophore receptor [Chitinasiproducens palmae]